MRSHWLLLLSLAGCFHPTTDLLDSGTAGGGNLSTGGGSGGSGGGLSTGGGVATGGGLATGGGSAGAGGGTTGMPSKWFQETVPAGLGNRNLLDVWASGQLVWVTGASNRILYREFGQWQQVPPFMSAVVDYVSVSAIGSEADIATSLGFNLHFTSPTVMPAIESVPVTMGEQLRAVGGGLIVGGTTGASSTGVAFERGGAAAAWTRLATQPMWSELTGVWGLGGGTLAVDSTGRVWAKHFSPLPFSQVGSPVPGGNGGIWGQIAPNDALDYAVTANDGKLYVSGPNGLVGHGSGAVLRAVWGTSPTNLWAVGDNGRIAHFNGTTLTDVASPVTTTLRSVHGTGPDDIWAVGDNDVVLHYTGADGCQSDMDCASGSKCCYPCGIPGCNNRCTVTLMCPMIP